MDGTPQRLKENDPPKSHSFPATTLGKAGKNRLTASVSNEGGGKLGRREPLRPVAKGTLKSTVAASPAARPSARLGESLDTASCPPQTPNHPLHVWDDPESEAAPAAAWSTLGNRSLLCRPLPLDVGRCICYISRERHESLQQSPVYALYTDEGQGRKDRKLAVARHQRRSGRSEFLVYPTGAETGRSNLDAVLGRMQANLLGSRYLIWDEVASPHSKSAGRQLLGVAAFEPTITTLTGTFRVMRVCIPKYQSMQLTSSTQHERNGLSHNWEENVGNAHLLCSRRPYYNKTTRRYELDYRDRAKRSSKIKTSAKNVQLTMEENGKQAILLLGKVGKSKYVLEYRFPLTGYQAFCISLASIDSKLCCSL